MFGCARMDHESQPCLALPPMRRHQKTSGPPNVRDPVRPPTRAWRTRLEVERSSGHSNRRPGLEETPSQASVRHAEQHSPMVGIPDGIPRMLSPASGRNSCIPH